MQEHHTDRLKPNAAVILDWKPVVKNTLRGFARVKFASGMIVSEVSVHVRDGNAWAGPPSRQQIDRNGQVVRDETGKPKWTAIVEFATRQARDAWSEQVIAAIEASHPGALEGGEG